MKQILKRSLSVILAITIVFSSAYVGLNELDFSGIFAVETKAASVGNLSFTLNDDGESYSVTGCDTYASGTIVIPDDYEGLPVTSIGYSAFENCDSLTSITISDSVTSIGSSAFEDCTSLESVVIPDGVTSIGNSVFYGCTSLTSIVIPDSVTSISYNVFYNCKSLESVVIPDSVTSISWNAFYSCTSLESIEIPDSVTSIGDCAFYNCESLATVLLGAGVAEIGYNAFSCCPKMEAINVDSNNKNYSSDNGVLFNVDKTTLCCFPGGYGGAYSIPNSVTSIGGGAFSDCEKLTSITIPDSVTNIGDYAFSDCRSLTSITIPNSVTSIGNSAFYYCDSLTSITLGNGVTSIGEGTFFLCYSLASITIPDSVTSIGGSAFEDCEKLTSITIPDSVTNIGDYAFSDCKKLKYVFYSGTQEEWAAITNGSNNPNLIDAKIHYEATYHTASDWTISKEATVKASGSKYKKCTQCGLRFETETIPQLKCSKTKLSKISNTSSGVKISWDKVEGADSYIVYRKTKGGSWNKIGSTSKTSYTDKKAKSGTTYYYAVKAKNEAGNTDYSNSLSIKRLSVPKLSSVANTSSGVKVTWKKVNGASGYIVYRKTKSGDWKEIGKTTKLYYTDKKAKSGTSYYYSVRAYSGSVKSYYDTDGLSIRRLVTPKISSATSKSEGILIKWNKITGASGYYVYRKASSGEWKKIATVKGNSKIKYLDESPRKGATYQYRVKAYYSKSTSANSNSYKINCKY